MKEAAKSKAAKKLSLEGRKNGGQEGRLLSLNKLPSPQRGEGAFVGDERAVQMRVRGSIPDKVFSRKRFAFTLAEVLITLGIIGVVASMTLPVVVQKCKNIIVETRLKKVYTIMNQAIQRAEADYGAKEDWDFSDENFWNKYFAPYIKVVKIERIKDNNYTYNKIYLPDGSLLISKYMQVVKDENDNESEVMNVGYGSNADYFFYPNAKNFNMNTFSDYSDSGKNFFIFRFAQNVTTDYFHYRKGFMPYAHGLHQNFDNMYEGGNFSCNKNSYYNCYCTFAIMQNGWKIPKDYPFKVK